MVRATFVSLLLAGMVVFVMGVPGGSAEERVEGKVVKTHLTACGVVPGKAGTCEGTLELERQVGEQAERMMVQITRDTVLKKGEEEAFLFQLEGSSATVAYVKEGDQKVATSVVTKPAGR
ncbi:MAG: hypothetical protein ACREOH_24245 [Candidatus Entotheonellia bacterium]